MDFMVKGTGPWGAGFLVLFIAGAALGPLIYRLLISEVLQQPYNIWGLGDNAPDPRDAILNFKLLSLQNLPFRLAFLSLVISGICVIYQMVRVEFVARNLVIKAAIVYFLISALSGLLFGIVAKGYWEARSHGSNYGNVQAYFVYDVYYFFLSIWVDWLFTFAYVIATVLFIKRIKGENPFEKAKVQ